MSSNHLRTLIVEDDHDLASAVIDYFAFEDIHCDHVSNGVACLQMIEKNHYDVIILDINLPRMDGFAICEKLRLQGIETPIIMLTALDSLDDKLEGFSRGADDYLIKPFAMEELIARTISLSKRRSAKNTTLSIADLTIDVQKKTVNRAGNSVVLSPICFKILEVLMRESPNLVTREQLMFKIWGEEQPGSNSLKVHIFNLRQRVEQGHQKKLIQTIAKQGFVLAEGFNSED